MGTVDPTKHSSALGSTARTYRAFQEIAIERAAQDAKWGVSVERNLDWGTWLAILTEEVGEFARAILNDDIPERQNPKTRLKEIIQVAAVATAILEVVQHENDTGPLL